MHRKIGKIYENKTLDIYLRLGYEKIASSYFSSYGEIDVIVRSKSFELVFIEVKARSEEAFIQGLASISQKKQKRILYTAKKFLQETTVLYQSCRFDVVIVDITTDELFCIQDAFDASPVLD
ncbi:MAG: YraN family protein [Pseudomonadota bacterium]|nr:YraN family protein [Pseudomonadota bacterium]